MKNILNKCLLIALLACLPGLIQAQRVLIRGVVTAYEDKQPLPGAYLLLQNSDGRVVANTITLALSSAILSMRLRYGSS